MKRSITALLLLAMALGTASPVAAARVVMRHARGPHHRTTVVVHRGWPLRRPLPVVVVRPAAVRVVVVPRIFLAPVIWTAVVVSAPPVATAMVWEDSQILSKDEDWTECTLVANRSGRKLFLQVHGEATLNFAEVVFENGETQVVDFEEKTHGTGLYGLLDFADGRKVDHVRLVARAESAEAKVILRLS